MTATKHNDRQNARTVSESSQEEKQAAPVRDPADDTRTPPDSFRDASYVVLFIAAVFVVNAMETGSYRIPWPVALGAAAVGLGLFVYSWYHQFRSRP